MGCLPASPGTSVRIPRGGDPPELTRGTIRNAQTNQFKRRRAARDETEQLHKRDEEVVLLPCILGLPSIRPCQCYAEHERLHPE